MHATDVTLCRRQEDFPHALAEWVEDKIRARGLGQNMIMFTIGSYMGEQNRQRYGFR